MFERIKKWLADRQAGDIERWRKMLDERSHEPDRGDASPDVERWRRLLAERRDERAKVASTRRWAIWALVVVAVLGGTVTAAVVFRSAIPFGTAGSWNSAVGADPNAVRGPWYNTNGHMLAHTSDNLDSQLDIYKYSVMSYGCKGDNVVDDTTCIQNAITAAPAGSVVFFPPGYTFKITSGLTVTANHITISGYGAKIVQSGTLQPGFTVTGTDSIIQGLWLYNSRGGADWNNASPTAAIGINFSGSDNSIVEDCRIENWGGIGIKYLTSPGLLITRNRIIGIGAAGGLVANSNNNLGTAGYGSGAGSNGVRIQENYFSDLAQGSFQGNDWSDTSVLGNYYTNIIGQNAVYFDNIFNASIVGNVIDTTGQCGIYLQVASNATQDGGGVVISGNVVQNVIQDGILFIAGQGGLTNYHRGVVISGNTVRNATGNGIQLNQVDNYIVTDNVIDTTGNWGIFAGTTARNGRIANNLVKGTAYNAMYLATETPANTYKVVVENNTTQGCNTTSNGTTYYNAQFFISTGNFLVRNNIFQSPGGAVLWGIYTDATAHYVLQQNQLAGLSNTFGGTLDNASYDAAGGTSPHTDYGQITQSLAAVGTSTTTYGLIETNSSAAANGAQQYSPAQEECGNGWGTTAGTSQAVCFQRQVIVTQSTTPVGEYDISYSINGAAPTRAFYVNSAGDVAAPTGNARFLGGSLQRISSGTLSVCTDANCTGLTLGKSGVNATSPGGLAVGQGFAAAYRTAATTVTVATTDTYVGVSGTGARTVNLPAASTCIQAGQEFVIQDVGNDVGTITINRAGADTINGAATATISAAFGAKTLVCDKTSAWFAR